VLGQARRQTVGRTKQQWIDETGGFGVGESETQFQQRLWRIRKIRNDINKGVASPEDINELAKLLGTGEDDESIA